MNEKITDDSLLHCLRDLQGREKVVEHQPFSEWRDTGGMERDIESLLKARSGMAGMAHMSPGFGAMGGHLNTSSRAPTGPTNRRSGLRGMGLGGDHNPRERDMFNSPRNQRTPQFGVPSGSGAQQPSKYDFMRPNQPPPWIDDVNMESIWYSPFEPVWPFGPPYYTVPREWNFPVGYNLNFIQARQEIAETLRGMRSSWGVLSTVIQTRKAQLTRLPWTIQVRNKPRQNSKGVDELRKFFRRPDGKSTFLQWVNRLLDDAFVIDAPVIYQQKAITGKLLNCQLLDGATMFPLIDDTGRRPDTIYDINSSGEIDYIKRQPAFQQIIYGLPMINLSEDEIIYGMRNPLPAMPMFGYSEVNQIYIEATEAIRKTLYQSEFWRSGSMPELMVTVPDTWSPRQIAQFQGHFDAVLSGNLTLKSKVRFIPGGMKPFDIKNASGESLWSERDEMLVRLCCYAFSVSPTAFVKQTNRGTATNQAQSAQEEGLYPLMSWFKDDIMDNIIQERFGYDDIEFVFQPQTEIDQEKRAKIHQIKLNSGEMTIDEARAENGEEPLPNNLGSVPLIITGGGAVRLEDVVNGMLEMPGAPAKDPSAKVPAKNPMQREQTPQRGAATSRVSNKPSPIHKVKWSDIKQAGKETDLNPTHAQRHVGNYQKGHVIVQGLDITIENPKGSKRAGKDRTGKKWEIKMPTTYGYIKGTIGADNEHMDCYLGKKPKSEIVFVVDQDQVDLKGNPIHFDEHKCFIGYKGPHKVIKDYLKAHLDDKGLDILMAVTALSMVDFKSWLRDGDMHKPISEQYVGTVIARRGEGMLAKMDTISGATGLGWYDQGAAKKRGRRKKENRYEG
jgi:hypothetical protein